MPYLCGFLFIIQLKYRHIWLYASLGSKVRSGVESVHYCLIKESGGCFPTSGDEFLEINARLTNFSTICFEVAFNNTLSPERSAIIDNRSQCRTTGGLQKVAAEKSCPTQKCLKSALSVPSWIVFFCTRLRINDIQISRVCIEHF